MEQSPLRWVVTAPPRSGTTWIAKWLGRNGYPTLHERALLTLNPDDPSLLHITPTTKPGESSWLAAPWTPELRQMGIPIIHLRRPLHDIATSMQRLNWDFTTNRSFDTMIPLFTPHVITDHPHQSYNQYYAFAESWTNLIQADTVWELYDVENKADEYLTWLENRLENHGVDP